MTTHTNSGEYYADMALEPYWLGAEIDLNMFQGDIVRRLSRYHLKDGMKDLDKAMAAFDAMVWYNKCKAPWWMTWKGNRLDKRTKKVLDKYCSDNNLHHDVRLCLIYALKSPWSSQDEYNNQEAFRAAIARLKDDLRYNLATG